MTACATRALKSPEQYCISFALHKDITRVTAHRHGHHLETPQTEKMGENKGKTLS